MVQQLSLYGSIDDSLYDLFISTMKTLSGNPPVLFGNIASVWNPNPSYDIEKVNAKNQLVEPNRIKLSKSLPFDLVGISSQELDHTLLMKLVKNESLLTIERLQDFLLTKSDKPDSESKMDIDSEESNELSAAESSWTLSITDIPAAGTSRKVSIQSISESVILSTDESRSSLNLLLNGLGYVHGYQYITVGVKFFLANNLVVDLQKIWNFTNNSKIQVTEGGFLLKAYVNVSRNTDIDRMNQGETALLALQKELHGYVDLSIPDRKCMDSRPNYSNDLI